MNQDIHLEERYEIFEGDLRKLDELIGQLELWSDEYTINHKKEEVRLPQYVELNNNLEELQETLQEFISERLTEENEEEIEKLTKYKELIEEKLEKYKVTEKVIHDWIRAIKKVQVIIANSPVLEENREYLERILQ